MVDKFFNVILMYNCEGVIYVAVPYMGDSVLRPGLCMCSKPSNTDLTDQKFVIAN